MRGGRVVAQQLQQLGVPNGSRILFVVSDELVDVVPRTNADVVGASDQGWRCCRWRTTVEIEQQLLQLPGVERVAVRGYPDERLGQRVGAVVVGHHGLTVATLLEHLDGRGVATYKKPEPCVSLITLD